MRLLKKRRAAAAFTLTSGGWADFSPTGLRAEVGKAAEGTRRNGHGWPLRVAAQEEVIKLERERKHLQANLAGIRT